MSSFTGKEPELLREIANSISGIRRALFFFLPENVKMAKELQGSKKKKKSQLESPHWPKLEKGKHLNASRACHCLTPYGQCRDPTWSLQGLAGESEASIEFETCKVGTEIL